MASQDEIPRLSTRALQRFRDALNRISHTGSGVIEFREHIERYETSPRCLCTLNFGVSAMLKQMIALIRAYVDARITHALIDYHAKNHGGASRAMTREVADHLAIASEAGSALEDFGTRVQAHSDHVLRAVGVLAPDDVTSTENPSTTNNARIDTPEVG